MSTPRPALTGLLETCLYVTDVRRSRAFYQQIFGFSALMDGDDRIQAMDVAPGQVLLLFRRGGTLENIDLPTGRIPAHDGSGEQHFAFSVPEDTFEKWRVFLAEQDVAIESEVRWPQGGRSLYFRDPDRLVIELATPGLWANYRD